MNDKDDKRIYESYKESAEQVPGKYKVGDLLKLKTDVYYVDDRYWDNFLTSEELEAELESGDPGSSATRARRKSLKTKINGGEMFKVYEIQEDDWPWDQALTFLHSDNPNVAEVISGHAPASGEGLGFTHKSLDRLIVKASSEEQTLSDLGNI